MNTYNISIYPENISVRVIFHTIKECPMCHVALEPVILHKVITWSSPQNRFILTLLSFCTGCDQTFITRYALNSLNKDSFSCDYIHDGVLLDSLPFCPIDKTFPENIIEISPRFVQIYNQSFQAEQEKLLDICGMGYRKALEFLVKDYLIYKYPDEKEKFEKASLSNCVKRLSELNSSLEIIASRATWLGNDETHYIKKQIDYDLNTLKLFINAFVTCIDLLQITDMAASIQPMK